MKTKKQVPTLIGISGKKGSGKDTVGRILQYMLSSPNTNYGLAFPPSDVINYALGPTEEIYRHYQIKKYAYPLKQMVCILIGCTMEDLENEEFKSSTLGPEWDREYWSIDSRDNKEIVTSFHKETILQDLAHYEEYYEHEVTVSYHKKPLTVRELLQLLGTECMKGIIHPNGWINALFAQRKEVFTSPWIITDVRFEDEKKAIEKRGGIVIRVNRPDLPSDMHSSETALDNAKFDFVINNNKDLVDLYFEVRNIISQYANK